MDIDVLDAAPLDRLVFEDGRVVGVVLATADGPYAIRARRGVTISPTERDFSGADPVLPDYEASMRVCVVGRTASRFGRVELVSVAAAGISAAPDMLGSATGASWPA